MPTEAVPERSARDDSADLPIEEIVGELQSMLGSKLVAYMGSAKETRTVRLWMEGESTAAVETEQRLRLAYQAARLVYLEEQDRVVHAWFQGRNPLLVDRSPARLIREADPQMAAHEVLAAAREFSRLG